ncbi:MAG: sigma-54 dependent transcriptional regulator [Gemmatimonadota bacterium]
MSDLVLITSHRLPLAGRLREAFEGEGYRVDFVPEPAHLESQLDPVLLILTGERGPEELTAWMETAGRGGQLPVFTILTGPGGEARGRRAGAEESFGPDPDSDEVVLLAHRMIQRRRLQRLTGIIGEAESIREVLERVIQIAPVNSTVLITGESGTGKELVARGIHALSPRRHRAFLGVNVAALSETLLESELFGHEKGAFTGAIDSRKGFFELAHKGTLFLDEIGEMPLSTQTKLLRVLEQREFLRVGGEKTLEVDVRIIAATNQELRHLVRSGRFRRDLYYRLNILGIMLPPLRSRREDVPRLIDHFVRELSERMDRPFPGLSDQAMEYLVRYDWPGNVRELRNLVESMVVLSPGKIIGPEDIPREMRSPTESARLLPVPVTRPPEPPPGDEEPESSDRPRLRPELEFVFRTLVELKMDVDQLRREFDLYRDDIDERLEEAPVGRIALPVSSGDVEIRIGEDGMASAPSDLEEGGTEEVDGSEQVVFRPGMTIDEMEAQAIRLALLETGGNRRMAAEALGIGERTLYRKIQRYGIDV